MDQKGLLREISPLVNPIVIEKGTWIMSRIASVWKKPPSHSLFCMLIKQTFGCVACLFFFLFFTTHSLFSLSGGAISSRFIYQALSPFFSDIEALSWSPQPLSSITTEVACSVTGAFVLTASIFLSARKILTIMSSSITIPSRSGYGESSKAGGSSNSSSSSSYSTSPRTPQQSSSTSSSPKSCCGHDRRPSLLSTSLSKQEHTVINIGDPDGPPRLITCVRSSQGFDWNPEIFLPSYVECDFESLERKRDPVHEILLSDEESQSLLPQWTCYYWTIHIFPAHSGPSWPGWRWSNTWRKAW